MNDNIGEPIIGLDDLIGEQVENVRRVAVENLREEISSEEYTDQEVQAMVDFEMLDLVKEFEEEYLKNEFNLSIVLIYAWLIADIEDYGLWQSMPGNFNSAEEAIEQLGGLPRTKQARIKTLFA